MVGAESGCPLARLGAYRTECSNAGDGAPVLIDGWLIATVVVFAGALICETAAGYLLQRSRVMEAEPKAVTTPGGPKWFVRTWWGPMFVHYRSSNSTGRMWQIEPRFGSVTTEMSGLLRGIGRLAVSVTLLARFAAGLPPPWA